MNDKINIFEPKNKKKPLIVSKLRNKNKKVCFSCESEKQLDEGKINNKSLNNQEDIISFEEDYLKKISKKSKFIESNFNNDNSYVRKTLKKKLIEQNNKENLRKSKKSNKNHREKNLKYTDFISKVKFNVKNKEKYYDDNKSNLSNKSIKRINYNPNNSTDKVKNNPFCNFLNQFVNNNQRKTNIKNIKTIKENHNNNENSHDIYISKNQNIKINLFENLRIINNINFYFQGNKNQDNNLNYIREKNDVILKLKIDLQNSENNIKELLSNIQKLKNELKIKENIIKELSMNNEKIKKEIENLNKTKKEDNLNININNNKFNNNNNSNNIKTDNRDENYKNLITYNINKNNNYNIINSNINKIENINIIQNNKENIINEEIKKKQNEKERKANRAFERFKRVNKSADVDKQKNCKKSEKISEMAKMLEKNMENKNNLDNSDDINLNKNNEYNDNIVNIINSQPVVNKKKKKRNFSFDADFN